MSTAVRVPSYAVDLISKWRRTASALREELGRPASKEEIALRLGLCEKRLRILEKALQVYSGVGSAGSSEEGFFSDALADNRLPAPEANLSIAEEVQKVLSLVDGLDERQRKVLHLRFGLDGSPPHTLRAVGLKLGLTRERVRQIEHEALARLRDKI